MPGTGRPPPDPSFQPLGHIALDREDYCDPPNKDLASKETGVVTLATFFILKSQQGRGLGSAAMDLVEEEAKALGAPWITLNTSVGLTRGLSRGRNDSTDSDLCSFWLAVSRRR